VASTTEIDTYPAAGLLGQVTIGSYVRATYEYDAYERAYDYTEYTATVAHTVTYDRTISFDDGGAIQQDNVTTVRGSTTTRVNSTYTYNVYGQVTDVQSGTQINGGAPTSSETRYFYFLFDGASETA